MRILRFAKFVAESAEMQGAQPEARVDDRPAPKVRKAKKAGRTKPVSVPGWTKY